MSTPSSFPLGVWRVCRIVLAGWTGLLAAQTIPTFDGITYTNDVRPEIPWSIHVVRYALTNRTLELRSVHAGGGALGLSALSAQLRQLATGGGTLVAGINGDFYDRGWMYAGDARGLQIVDGEVISAPAIGTSFWMDAFGHPHAGEVAARFVVTWPNGAQTPFDLNEERRSNRLVLYSPALGPSTRTSGGRELVLERAAGSAWLPLQMAETYTAKVREVHESGDTPIAPATMVLSIGRSLAPTLPAVGEGASIRLTTGSSPNLWHAPTAISGGPLLVVNGRPVPVTPADSEAYQFTSMLERHPRSAIGWNRQYFFMVEVDGRQRWLSVGMTLNELAKYLVRLGCEEGMNFDGGGSATLWFGGRVRNQPCDGRERPVANCLAVVQKPAGTGNSSQEGHGSTTN